MLYYNYIKGIDGKEYPRHPRPDAQRAADQL